MVQLFISHSEDDGACAEQLRADFEANGYHVWKHPHSADRASLSYPRAIEDGIRGSAAIVLVWSASAARSEWVERQILFAQRLQKPIVPVVIDGTDLPITLVNVQSLTGAPPCAGVAAQLLPHLPPADSADLLNALLEQLPHPYIRERKAGIERAAELLRRGEHREEVLALLEDIARKDLMEGVREMARGVIAADAQGAQSPARAEEIRHIFGTKCPNGHITYFDKRRVCPPSGIIKRSLVERGGAELDEIYLKCNECGSEMAVRVDCEGYL